jgi:hypothetical protein
MEADRQLGAGKEAGAQEPEEAEQKVSVRGNDLPHHVRQFLAPGGNSSDLQR